MIVITGANGFIGSHLAWEFKARGAKDLLLVDTVPPRLKPNLIEVDETSPFMLAEPFLEYLKTSEAKKRITAIVHMGACSDTTEMDRAYLRRVNTSYTLTLFNWCAENDKDFIFASSGATYGLGEHGFDDTTNPSILKPLNPYGDSKLAVDIEVLKAKHTPPRWFALRFFNVYGPNEFYKGAMASVVHKAYLQIRTTSQLKLFRSGHPDYEDGKQMRDFIYVKDITHWIWNLLTDRKLNRSGIYNMGSGHARTWLDLARAVFTQMGYPEPRIDWIDMPANLSSQYQYFTEARMERLLSLGLNSPQWSLELGIEDMMQSYFLKGRFFLL